MFTRKEISTIDREYFRVIRETCYYVTLQSRNTKHCWHIESLEGNGWRSCRIHHTHHEGTPYHPQTSAPNLIRAQQKIKEHDWYHLEIRTAEKEGRRKERLERLQHAHR